MSAVKQAPAERPVRPTAAERQRRFELLNEAIIAVSTLANHLEEIDDLTRLYGANRALRELWAME